MSIYLHCTNKKYLLKAYAHTPLPLRILLLPLIILYIRPLGYYSKHGDEIHLNLSNIHRTHQKGIHLGKAKPHSLHHRVCITIEHEALHKAIYKQTDKQYEGSEHIIEEMVKRSNMEG